MTRDELFNVEATALGHSFAGEIKIGGNYSSVLRDHNLVFVSGQIPRVGDAVVVSGIAGADVDLKRARHAAEICAMRSLALLGRFLGGLDHVHSIMRMTVYVRSAPDFSQQSEVADAASGVLLRVLGEAGVHTRTSIGVLQLPKGATVEVDLIATTASGLQ